MSKTTQTRNSHRAVNCSTRAPFPKQRFSDKQPKSRVLVQKDDKPVNLQVTSGTPRPLHSPLVCRSPNTYMSPGGSGYNKRPNSAVEAVTPGLTRYQVFELTPERPQNKRPKKKLFSPTHATHHNVSAKEFLSSKPLPRKRKNNDVEAKQECLAAVKAVYGKLDDAQQNDIRAKIEALHLIPHYLGDGENYDPNAQGATFPGLAQLNSYMLVIEMFAGYLLAKGKDIHYSCYTRKEKGVVTGVKLRCEDSEGNVYQHVFNDALGMIKKPECVNYEAMQCFLHAVSQKEITVMPMEHMPERASLNNALTRPPRLRAVF